MTRRRIQRAHQAATLFTCLTLFACSGQTPGPETGGAQPRRQPPPQQQRQAGSLLHLIPPAADLAFVINEPALALIRSELKASPGFEAELKDLLQMRVGVDLTTATGAVLFADLSAGKEAVAGIIRTSKPAGPVKLKEQQRRRHHFGRRTKPPKDKKPAFHHSAVPVFRLERSFVAVVPGGVALGNAAGIRLAIDAAAKGAPSGAPTLDQRSPLSALTKHDLSRTWLAGAMANSAVESLREAKILALPRAVRSAALVHGAETIPRLTIDCAKGQAEAVKKELDLSALIAPVIRAIDSLRLTRDRRGSWLSRQVTEGLVRSLRERLVPRAEGTDRLVLNLNPVKADLRGWFPLILGYYAARGFTAAVERVPTVKTHEATRMLDQIAEGARALVKRQPKGQRAAFRFPASTRWTPERDCCSGPAAPRCPAGRLDHSTWRALKVPALKGHYFLYRFTSEGVGAQARFIAEARADLDCDGAYSNFQIRGSLNARFELEVKQPYVEQRLE